MQFHALFLVLLGAAAAVILHSASAPPALPIGSATVERDVAAASASRDQDRIWSALVYATNVADPKPAPSELREFAPRLKRVFGYNQFEVKGSAAKPIDAASESWLVPGSPFRLGIKARRSTSKEARGGYLLNVQLIQGDRPIVDTEAKLAPGSPLFIRGPACAKGHLLIVLQVQR